MVKIFLVLVVIVVTQDSLQASIKRECHPDGDVGVCINEEATDARFDDANSFRNYRTNSYESIRDLPENDEIAETTQILRNYQDHIDDYDVYNSDSMRFDSSDNRGDVSVAIDKNDNDEDVYFDDQENLRTFSESRNRYDDQFEFEPINNLRQLREIHSTDDIKFENHDSIKTHIDKNQWIINPVVDSDFEKRFIGGIIRFGLSEALSYGVGKVVDKFKGK